MSAVTWKARPIDAAARSSRWEVVEGERVIATGLDREEAQIIEQARPALDVLNDVWDRDNPRELTPVLLSRMTYVLRDVGWTDEVADPEDWDEGEPVHASVRQGAAIGVAVGSSEVEDEEEEDKS